MCVEIEGKTIEQLHGLANNYLRQICNHAVVLAMQSEYTHLIITKSSDIPHLYINDILDSLTQNYGGHLSKNQTFGHATFYQQGIIPELLDRVVESVIVALPYKH